MADAAIVVLLESQHPDGAAGVASTGPAGQRSDLRRHQAEIDQATGMVSVQLGVPSARPLSGCGPALMLKTGGSATSPAISSPAACG